MDSNEERVRRVHATGSTPRGDARLRTHAFRGPSAIPMVECVGCGQDFSTKGYTYHIRRTRHLPCILAYEQDVRRAVASLHDTSDGAHWQLNGEIIAPAFDDEALNWDDENGDDEESEAEDDKDAEDDEDNVDITGELQELPSLPDDGILPEQLPEQPQANGQVVPATHPPE